jgi:ribosomal protein S18 acetylase RimI-like enzyme
VRRAQRIQAYLRATARGFYDAVPSPPFTAFLSPRDPLRFFNYAIPDAPVGRDLTHPELAKLRAVFRERERLPRFEYVEDFAPDLEESLVAAGFELELRAPLMTCPSKALVEPPLVDGLELVPMTAESGLEAGRAFLTVRARAFGSGDEPSPPDDDVDYWLGHRDLAGQSVMGTLDGEPVAVASATPPLDGLSEIAGVAVLHEARRSGIGSAVTAAAARMAFAAGADVAFLAPGSDAAQSIYARAGFTPQQTMLHYADPE